MIKDSGKPALASVYTCPSFHCRSLSGQQNPDSPSLIVMRNIKPAVMGSKVRIETLRLRDLS